MQVGSRSAKLMPHHYNEGCRNAESVIIMPVVSFHYDSKQKIDHSIADRATASFNVSRSAFWKSVPCSQELQQAQAERINARLIRVKRCSNKLPINTVFLKILL